MLFHPSSARCLGAGEIPTREEERMQPTTDLNEALVARSTMLFDLFAMDRLGDSDEFTHEQLDAAESHMAFALLALGNPGYVDGQLVCDERKELTPVECVLARRGGHDGR
jgi:hypothetical protein